MVGLASLFRSAMKGRGRGSGTGQFRKNQGRYSRKDAQAARDRIQERGDEFRDAKSAAGGDSEVARDMIAQRRKEEREAHLNRDDGFLPKELSIAGLTAMAMSRFDNAMMGPMRSVDRGAMVVGDNFRGATMSLAGEVPIFGKYAGKLLESLGKLTDAIEHKAEALSPYSGELTVANTQNRVRQLMADIEESRRAGSAYARTITEQSVLQTQLQSAMTPLKIELADFATESIKLARDLVEVAKPLLPLAEGGVRTARQTLETLRLVLRQTEFGAKALDAMDKRDKAREKFEDMKLQEMWKERDPATNHRRIKQWDDLPADNVGLGAGDF